MYVFRKNPLPSGDLRLKMFSLCYLLGFLRGQHLQNPKPLEYALPLAIWDEWRSMNKCMGADVCPVPEGKRPSINKIPCKKEVST